MRNEDVMDNSQLGLAYNFLSSFFGWAMLTETVECIKDTLPYMDYLKIIVTPAADSGIDVTSKILVLVLTVLSIITSCITIGQFIYKIKNKRKK
jgi:hypothetical protein|tara:strand:+ start:1113 stop:1394 length:282 start_codon:yes stop_codon:yes gene_type:complete